MIPLVLLFLGAFVQGPGSATPDALQTLITNTIATCGHACWVQLNAPTGGQARDALNSYGLTAANFNGLTGDPFANDTQVQQPPTGSGPAPALNSDGGLFSFSAPGLRYPDGKICSAMAGGHGASGIAAVFCFDVMAAAANKNGGGSGGTWTIPVKPARFLGAGDSKPAWSPQPSGIPVPAAPLLNGWYTINPSGQQMSQSCHEYYSTQWIPNTHDLIWGGVFCLGYTNAAGGPGGYGWYDDDTPTGTDSGTVHFPTLVCTNCPNDPGSYGLFWHAATTANLSPGAMNDLTGCYNFFAAANFFKACGLTSTPPTITGIGSGANPQALGNSQAIMVPDPSNPGTKRWFISYWYPGQCPPSSFPVTCLAFWQDTGVTADTAYTFTRVILQNTTPSELQFAGLSTGMCYDAASNIILMSHGGQHIYSIADLNTGVIDTNLTNWGWAEYTPGTIHGVIPLVSSDSGALFSCLSLEPAYHAVLLMGVDQGTSASGVYLYVK